MAAVENGDVTAPPPAKTFVAYTLFVNSFLYCISSLGHFIINQTLITTIK